MASNVGNLNIKVGFDGSAAAAGLAQLTNDLAEFGSDTEKYFEKFNKLGQMIGSLGSGGGFGLAGFVAIGAAVTKFATETAKAAAKWETIQRSAEAAAAHSSELAQRESEYSNMGPIGKAMALPGAALSGLTSGAGKALAGLTSQSETLKDTTKDMAGGVFNPGVYLDRGLKTATAVGEGDIGPISALAQWDPTGILKGLNDLSDMLVGADTTDQKMLDAEAKRAQRAFLVESQKYWAIETARLNSIVAEADQIANPLTRFEQQVKKFQDEIDNMPMIVGREGMMAKLQAAIDKLGIDKEIDDAAILLDKANNAAEEFAREAAESFKKWESEFLSVATESESFAYKLQQQLGNLADSKALGDDFGASVAERRIGKMGAGLLAKTPEFTNPDPFAGVSLAGSQEAYRDSIRSQFPPEALSVQERMATAIDEMNRKSEEELSIQEEVLRVLQGQGGPKLAHML